METKATPQHGSRIRMWIIPGIVLFLIAILVPVAMRLGHQTARAAQAHSEAVQLATAFQQYFGEYHAAPAGSPAQMVAALAGRNLRRIRFFEADPERFGAGGQLTDPWRTPYQFDLTDPAHPKVYSFGPNLRDDHGLANSDDVASWR